MNIRLASLRSLIRGRLRHDAEGRRPRFLGHLAERAADADGHAGRIYAQGTEVSLWQNVTARNVGDTLTIRSRESPTPRRTPAPRRQEQPGRARGPTIFGRPVTINGTPVLEGSMDNRSSFAGNGASKQSKRSTASSA
jgi:flagellar L-ring protein precursor FlgH